MNWVGGGLQRHSRGSGSDIKKQKAHFAKVRNGRRIHTSPRADFEHDHRVNAFIDRDVVIQDGRHRPAKIRTNSDSHAGSQPITPPTLILGQSRASADDVDLEASKQLLLASNDWLGLEMDPGVPNKKSSRASSDRRRRRLACPPLLGRSYYPDVVVRGAALPSDEELFVRVGSDVLNPSTSRINYRYNEDTTSSHKPRQQSTELCSHCDPDQYHTLTANELHDFPRNSSSVVLAQKQAGSTTSSDEILFDAPSAEEVHDDDDDKEEEVTADIPLSYSRSELAATAGKVETKPKDAMLERSSNSTGNATSNDWHAQKLWSMSEKSRLDDGTTITLAQHEDHPPLDCKSALSGSTEEGTRLPASLQQLPLCPETALHLDTTLQAPSPDSAWKRFIFGSASSLSDNSSLSHSSATRDSEPTSRLSLAARVSSSPCPPGTNKKRRQDAKNELDRPSIMVQPSRARTREVVEISSCGSSDDEDESECESDLRM